MKWLFVLYFWGLLFSTITIIHGSDSDRSGSQSSSDGERFKEAKQKLNELANNGRSIGGALQLVPQGYLGEGGYGLVYKGIRLSDSRQVAIKFINTSNEESAKREYTIYSYLHAIDNPNNEKYGIPVIYWYGHWEEFIVMALTLLEGSLFDKACNSEFKEPLDNLIIFHQFVRQAKYIHSCGVRHDDIKGENIMFRGHESFLIDYNLSSEMEKDTYICTYLFKPRRCHREYPRFAMDDMESFFYTMCYLNRIDLKWFFNEEYKHLDEDEFDRRVGRDKMDIKHILRKVNNIRSIPMRNVFKAFYNEIFGARVKEYPNYDGLAQIIAIEINKLLPANQPMLFTWMTQTEINAALEHISESPELNIHTDIGDPSQINFNHFEYPHVDFDYFTKTTA